MGPTGIITLGLERIPQALVEMSAKHQEPGWDMHRPGSVEPVSLPRGEVVRGEVVCHHPFGLGLYLPDHDSYGHVNIPEVSDVVVHGPNEFPPIGTQGSARVLGPSGGTDQLTLTLRTPATP